MQSKAKTVEAYLAELPEDRRAALQAVRRTILANLDPDYEEGMQYGAISYYVPHRVFPAGYHCDPRLPLPFAGLGWQKHHMGFGMMCHYSDERERAWFVEQWAKTGKKLDMGKCCIRFKRLEDVPLELIGEAVRRVPARDFVARYEAARAAATRPAAAAARGRAKRAAKKPGVNKAGAISAGTKKAGVKKTGAKPARLKRR